MQQIPDALKSKKVLIVDDAGSMRSLLASILKEFGLSRCDEAEDGEQALRKLQASVYNLVLCDWEMPHMNGLELLEKIRNDSSIDEVPFVMVTSLASAERVKQAIAVGVTDYVVKPITTETLMSKVADVLSRSTEPDAQTPP